MKWTGTSVLVCAMALLSSCQKESTAPANVSSLPEQELSGGELRIASGMPLALVVNGPATYLCKMSPTAYTNQLRVRVNAPGGPFDVNHFTGVTYDPVHDCLWFVTDATASPSAWSTWLFQYKLTTGLPTSGTLLVDPITHLYQIPQADVPDAWDIEYDGSTGNIYLLRNTYAGLNPMLATLDVSVSIGRVANIGTVCDIQGFTFNAAGNMRGLKTKATQWTTGPINKSTAVCGAFTSFLAPTPAIAPLPADGGFLFDRMGTTGFYAANYVGSSTQLGNTGIATYTALPGPGTRWTVDMTQY